jgi:cephalosporin hydroxylase
MSTLSELYVSSGHTTDKGTNHDYINGYYSHEFSDKRDVPINLLEIGIHHGHSILLWKEWFTQGNIFGIDSTFQHLHSHLIEGATVMQIDAYNESTLNQFEDEYFDYIIDDGPHTIESQIACINLWYPKLKNGGKIIIEDIQNFNTLHLLEVAAQVNNAGYKIFDLRNNKGQPDDVIFEVTKS